MSATDISWTEQVWNPTTGCDRVSPGCDHCYALTMARRLKAMRNPKYQRDGDPRTSGPGFGITEHPDALGLPLRWRKPSRIFVNSMSDLFHDGVSDEFIAHVFAVMALSFRHTFQVLTKRHGRMRSLLTSDEFINTVGETASRLWEGPGWHHAVDSQWPGWPLPNVHLGVSAEDQKWANIRVPALLETPAAVRWVSTEPLLGPIDFGPWMSPVDWQECMPTHSTSPECARCIKPGWIVVGGESGPGARPMDLAWAQRIVDDCKAADVPVFVKQLPTGLRGKVTQDIATFPESLRVREYPAVAS